MSSPWLAVRGISSSTRSVRSSSTISCTRSGSSATPARSCGVSRSRGTRLNRRRIDEMVGRSLMLVTALAPVIGYDKAAAIARKANDENLTLRQAALALGDIDERRFDEIVDPRKMVGRGIADS